MKKLLVASALLGIGAAVPAMAQDAGCGLGSLIITENTKVMQVLAATLNSTGVQTFAISTGTSNCKAQNLVMNEKAIQYFAEVNKDDLSLDMARGQGEKLATFAALYGCGSAEARADFGAFAQSNFGDIVSSSSVNAQTMISNLNQKLSAQPVAGCARI